MGLGTNIKGTINKAVNNKAICIDYYYFPSISPYK